MSILAVDADVSQSFVVDTGYGVSEQVDPVDSSSVAELEFGPFEVVTCEMVVDENVNGLPDDWELRFGLTGDNACRDADPDGDGRSNLQEYNDGTNPVVNEGVLPYGGYVCERFLVDTSIISVHDPICLIPVPVHVLSRAFICDTGGWLVDSDGDGLPDWWEARYSATGSKLTMQATSDDDEDGLSNYAEFIANTSPLDADSQFVIRGMEALDGPCVFRLSWNGASGRIYSIWEAQAVGSGWNRVAEVVGVDGLQSYDIGSDGHDRGGGSKFFKVTVEIPK